MTQAISTKGRAQTFISIKGRERKGTMKFKDFFVPRWQHSNPQVRINTVKKILDPKLLRHIAEMDEDSMVRETALSHLKVLEDQQVKVAEDA
jgi:hypothetical protein